MNMHPHDIETLDNLEAQSALVERLEDDRWRLHKPEASGSEYAEFEGADEALDAILISFLSARVGLAPRFAKIAVRGLVSFSFDDAKMEAELLAKTVFGIEPSDLPEEDRDALARLMRDHIG